MFTTEFSWIFCKFWYQTVENSQMSTFDSQSTIYECEFILISFNDRLLIHIVIPDATACS